MSEYVELVRQRNRAMDEGNDELAQALYVKIVKVVESGKVTGEEFFEATKPY